MIFPKPIKKGDTVATTAVSMGCVDEKDILRLEGAVKTFKEHGYAVKETDNVRHNEKLVSSSPEERTREFMELWEDEEVKWIIATSGGELLVEMLPFLKPDVFRSSTPKWVQGYSDPSLLNYFLTTNFNFATLNGVNFKSFGMKPLDKSVSDIFNFFETDGEFKQKSFSLYESERVESENPYEPYNLTEKISYKALYSDKGNSLKGRLIGGCIDTFGVLLGTKFDNTVNFCKQFNEGMLWYMDNCELSPCAFYRTVWHLKQAGWFNNANGFLIGRTVMDKPMFDFTYLDALHKAFDDMNVPVFYDLDIGHLPPQWLVINGSFGEFRLIGDGGEFIQRVE